MLPISRRNGFSDRNGIKPENTEIQLTNFDRNTRIRLINFIKELFYNLYNDVYNRSTYPEGSEKIQKFIKFIESELYNNVIDHDKCYELNLLWNKISDNIENDEYHSVLTIIEAIGQYLTRINSNKDFIYKSFNQFFEKEYIGYRFIKGIITPISNKLEIETINNALSNKYSEIHEHIFKATKLLSDREKPDYENSIKESITAIETLCKIITKENGSNSTLGKMLKEISKTRKVHPVLKEAFEKLYGYTCDETRIRHAGNIGTCHSTFGEAKFILVSCSAFINYLLDILSK